MNGLLLPGEREREVTLGVNATSTLIALGLRGVLICGSKGMRLGRNLSVFGDDLGCCLLKSVGDASLRAAVRYNA